ncbi:cyclic AMP-responsive element-binding protein 3-like protein 4 isoform X2 [Dermochelys coriacea]|uniref:cyclic AMP-responsive element-binding protein 3-like protein 4 isoform X2 n=1 Tax=Dermochelys coriacea TaxID=27794 RepID=UPI001CA7BBA6|nr:cyclic AMP-responsive element-binding protein 3-like protein 4 isoform X2 [Dermochelys coriacea]XP_043357966.1 cyclic AMP-responsive element-binding protein 3-like protein 4 isoform X2 [Dermochelys coriacea]
MGEPGSPALQAVLFEQQKGLFPSSTVPSQDPPFALLEPASALKKGFEEWAVSGGSGLNDSEPEDFLNVIINPNEVYSPGCARASPGSDSSISDEPGSDSPRPGSGGPAAFCAVICNQSDPLHSDMVSIQLGDWLPPLLIPDACIVNELSSAPLSDVARPGTVPMVVSTGDMQAAVALLQFPDLFLTDEEKRLLSQEGVSLPSNLPLTKAEERLLKKVRRKIRNKQSAQDSRRRKKDYIDGLESRVAACSAQNQQLQKKVQELEKHNVSLLDQLRNLQALIKPRPSKAAQTSTCILILIFSLGLVIFPSYSPLRGGSRGSQDSYQPTGVISRNILNQGEFSELAEAPSPKEPLAPEPEPPLEEQLGSEAAVEEGVEGAAGGPTLLGAGSQKKGTNMSAQAQLEQQAAPKGLPQWNGPGASRNAAKSVHADEM